MKRALKHKSNIYEYLDKSGVLDSGNDEEIKVARKEYWRKYRADWRKQKRKEQSEFTISFTKKEMRILNPAVQKHKISTTVFIKQATLAYIQLQFVIVDPTSVNDIRGLLTRNYTILQNIEEQNLFKETEASFIKRFELLETSIMDMLTNPTLMEG